MVKHNGMPSASHHQGLCCCHCRYMERCSGPYRKPRHDFRITVDRRYPCWEPVDIATPGSQPRTRVPMFDRDHPIRLLSPVWGKIPTASFGQEDLI